MYILCLILTRTSLRYSDFMVHEISRDKEVVHLTDMSTLPVQLIKVLPYCFSEMINSLVENRHQALMFYHKNNRPNYQHLQTIVIIAMKKKLWCVA